jgi:hypothetical protein
MRTSREVSTSTRQKISQSLKKAHAQKTEQEKQQTRERQSASMRAYWETIPRNEEDDEPEVDYASAW